MKVFSFRIYSVWLKRPVPDYSILEQSIQNWVWSHWTFYVGSWMVFHQSVIASVFLSSEGIILTFHCKQRYTIHVKGPLKYADLVGWTQLQSREHLGQESQQQGAQSGWMVRGLQPQNLGWQSGQMYRDLGYGEISPLHTSLPDAQVLIITALK